MPKNTQNTAVDSEQKKQHREEQARRAKRRSRQLLGLALAILIVVGAFSIVRWFVDVSTGLVQQSDSTEKDRYNARITPLVWFDVLPFDSLDKADQNILKESAIWGIMNELGPEIERNELGMPLIPAAEIDRYAADLYGPDFEFTHETFTDTYQGLKYTYDDATQIYTAPAAGLTPQYLPTVMEIVNESDVKRVVVGYVSTTGSNDELVSTPDFDHPARFMDYLFRRAGNEYYLYAIKPNLTYTVAAPSSQAASSSPAASSGETVVEGFEDMDSGSSGLPGAASSPAPAASDSASVASSSEAPADSSTDPTSVESAA